MIKEATVKKVVETINKKLKDQFLAKAGKRPVKEMANTLEKVALNRSTIISAGTKLLAKGEYDRANAIAKYLTETQPIEKHFDLINYEIGKIEGYIGNHKRDTEFIKKYNERLGNPDAFNKNRDYVFKNMRDENRLTILEEALKGKGPLKPADLKLGAEYSVKDALKK